MFWNTGQLPGVAILHSKSNKNLFMLAWNPPSLSGDWDVLHIRWRRTWLGRWITRRWIDFIGNCLTESDLWSIKLSIVDADGEVAFLDFRKGSFLVFLDDAKSCDCPLFQIWNASWFHASSLCRNYASLLCIVPILAYMLSVFIHVLLVYPMIKLSTLSNYLSVVLETQLRVKQ